MNARNPRVAEEPLSEASNVSLPSKKLHWMDTRLRTRLRAESIRLHYQQFDYSSTHTERARSEVLLSDAPDHSEAEPPALLETLLPPDEQPLSPEPANDDVLPSFTQHGVAPELFQTQDVPTETADAKISQAGTSAPLLTNPPKPGYPAPTSWLLDTTSLARVVGAGLELLYLVRHKQQVRSIRICAFTRKDGVAEDVLEVALLGGQEDTLPFLQSKQLVKFPISHQLHRILILMRPPRSLHLMLIKAPQRLTHTMANAVIAYLGIAMEPAGFAIAPVSWLRTSLPLFQLDLRKLRWVQSLFPLIHNGEPLVNREVIRTGKTYTGLERDQICPVDVILDKLSKSKVAEKPFTRFKDWTSILRGLEFTLAVTVPSVTPNIVFGPFNFEKELIQMVRCITVDLLSDIYGVTCQPGEVYRQAHYWWLLVSAFWMIAPVLSPACNDYNVYDHSDFLQVLSHIAMGCIADLNPKSAALRNILRKFGSGNVFHIRPKVDEVLTIPAPSSFIDNQIVHLLITRPSQFAPQITDDFFPLLGAFENFIIVQWNSWYSLSYCGSWAPTSQHGQILSLCHGRFCRDWYHNYSAWSNLCLYCQQWTVSWHHLTLMFHPFVYFQFELLIFHAWYVFLIARVLPDDATSTFQTT